MEENKKFTADVARDCMKNAEKKWLKYISKDIKSAATEGFRKVIFEFPEGLDDKIKLTVLKELEENGFKFEVISGAEGHGFWICW